MHAYPHINGEEFSLQHNVKYMKHNNRNNAHQPGRWIELTSSGLPQEAVISEKDISGATDNPVPWKEIILFSPISFSTWKSIVSQLTTHKRKSSITRKTRSETTYLAWRRHDVVTQ